MQAVSAEGINVFQMLQLCEVTDFAMEISDSNITQEQSTELQVDACNFVSFEADTTVTSFNYQHLRCISFDIT